MIPVAELMEEFERAYDLPPEWIRAGIADAIQKVMEARYRQRVWVFLDDDGVECRTWGRGKDGGPEQFVIPPEKIRGRNTMLRQIRYELHARMVERDYGKLLRCEKSLQWGEIACTGEDGSAYVRVELRLGEELTCVCPRVYQPPVERRNGYARGERRAFFVRRIQKVIAGGVPRLRVELSRVSKTLTELLIRHALDKRGWWSPTQRVICHARVPGVISKVASAQHLHPDVIREVQGELGERVRVRHGPKAKKWLTPRRWEREQWLEEAEPNPWPKAAAR